MFVDQKLIQLWIKHGYFVMGPDGAPMWSDNAIKRIPGCVRTLLYYLPYGGRVMFEQQCHLAGYQPKQMLHKQLLCTDNDAYGVPYDEFE